MIIQPEGVEQILVKTMSAEMTLKNDINARLNGRKSDNPPDILNEEENARIVIEKTIDHMDDWQLSTDDPEGLDPEDEKARMKLCLTGLLLARNTITGLYNQYSLKEALDILQDIDAAADIIIFSGREGAEI